MTVWPFIAFSAVFMALVCLHFLLAYRTWQSSRSEEYSDIDSDYVRIEDYFARSFRQKVKEWLDLPVHATVPGGIRIIRKINEQIRASGSLEHPWRTRIDDIQIVQGTFWCGTGCAFTREIYAERDAVVGAGTRLQAIAADGNLTLAGEVQVTRWADSAGEMEIGDNSVVAARATAGKSIHLHKGAQVGSACAPIITTAKRSNPGVYPMPEPAATPLELKAPAAASAPHALGKTKLDPRKFSALGTDCWVYNGDLEFSEPLRINSKLVVKGDCFIPDGSVVEQDLKAHGRITIGAGAFCMGNIVAGRDVWFGPASRFRGVVHAGKELRLGYGVCGGEQGAPVAAFAADRVTLEDGVAVYGKLASAGRVLVARDRVKAK